MNSAAHVFEVPPPDLRLVWLVPGLAMLAGIAGLLLAVRQQPREALLMAPVLVAVLALLWLALSRRRVQLADGVLEVVAGINRRRVPVAEIDLARARIVDLDEHTGLRPSLRTFGTAMPGYQAGHFRLRDGAPAFVLLTARRRVLLLPLRDGKRLLLSLTQPQRLLDALVAADRRR